MALTAKGPTVQRALSGSMLILTELYGKSAFVRRVVGCGQNPDYDAQVGVFDLSFDPSNFIDLSVDELVEVLNGQPKPIRVIQANNQPILLPMEFAPRHDGESGLDEELLEVRARVLRDDLKFQERVGQAISKRYPPREPVEYVEQQIFEGFYSRDDSQRIEQFHKAHWETRPDIVSRIEDRRARELGYRIIYIEKPELLELKIREWFEKWESERLVTSDENVPYRTLRSAVDAAQELSGESDHAGKQLMGDVLGWLQMRLRESEPKTTR